MISVSIWRKTLVANHACAGGLALFDAIAAQQPESDPRRLHRIRIPRWTALHWIMLVQSGFGEWLACRGIVPRADLSGADLGGADLTDADLRGAHLSGTDLRGANLRGAHLTGAYRGHDQPPIPGWRISASGYLGRDLTPNCSAMSSAVARSSSWVAPPEDEATL